MRTRRVTPPCSRRWRRVSRLGRTRGAARTRFACGPSRRGATARRAVAARYFSRSAPPWSPRTAPPGVPTRATRSGRSSARRGTPREAQGRCTPTTIQRASRRRAPTTILISRRSSRRAPSRRVPRRFFRRSRALPRAPSRVHDTSPPMSLSVSSSSRRRATTATATATGRLREFSPTSSTPRETLSRFSRRGRRRIRTPSRREFLASRSRCYPAERRRETESRRPKRRRRRDGYCRFWWWRARRRTRE